MPNGDIIHHLPVKRNILHYPIIVLVEKKKSYFLAVIQFYLTIQGQLEYTSPSTVIPTSCSVSHDTLHFMKRIYGGRVKAV